MKKIDRNKLVVITGIIVFIVCIVFYVITKKEVNRNVRLEESSEKQEEETERVPESDFNLENIEVVYQNDTSKVNMQELFEDVEQSNFFKYELYSYLYEHGYKKNIECEVQGGSREEGTEQVYFQIKVMTKEKEEVTVNCWYNEAAYSFYFSFAEEVNSESVTILEMDTELEQLIKSDLEKIEREFGKYLYGEKNDATVAKVTNYEIVGMVLEIQVELNDEYLTYCKIYYNTEEHSVSFKIWG